METKTQHFRHVPEEGSALVAVLMVLFLLTLIGVAATNKSGIEIRLADGLKNHDAAVEAAEAGMLFVLASNPGAYGDNNINPDLPVAFSNADTGPATNLIFSGTVTYNTTTDAAGKVLRGTGNSHGKFRMHVYQFSSLGVFGAGTRASTALVEATGYRLGF